MKNNHPAVDIVIARYTSRIQSEQARLAGVVRHWKLVWMAYWCDGAITIKFPLLSEDVRP